MSVFHVSDRSGVVQTLEAVDGWRLMELLRDYGLGIEAICGGACACATCHVVIAAEWAKRLPEPREDELERLDDLPIVEPNSRLSCQIIWSEALDGLTLSIPESF